ncbi:hypothetical protein THUN1379_26620 [Paludibacterium sp. THUN1379]|uniref:type III secretion system inner membrane ring subunit SctD n=1 Tax=Paludibacterium sp. THUN1379 TaxID=3112107 RepID=UPI003084C79B|nr:hypothetical protein THUN1379_26620 [Paludibacterium sp. THUN1379]
MDPRPACPYQLLLLSGPLAGRTLPLAIGTLTVGDEASDLALGLEGGCQAHLQIDEAGIALSNAIPCWVNGLPQPPGLLPLGSLIDLAGLHFVLAAEGETVQALPLLPRAVRAASRPHWPLWLGLSLLPLLIGSAWLLFAPPPASDLRWLQQASAHWPGLQWQTMADGSLQITGQCTDSRSLAGLRQQLARHGVRYRWQVSCQDEWMASVRALLQNHGYAQAQLTITADGILQIAAPWRQGGSLASLMAGLDQIPGLPHWQLRPPDGVPLASIVAALQQLGQLDGLSARHGAQGWLLSGALSPARWQRLRQAMTDPQSPLYASRLLDAPEAPTYVEGLSDQMAAIGGSRESPFLIMRNGLRLQVGSQLAGDWQILAIFPDGVSLLGRDSLLFWRVDG